MCNLSQKGEKGVEKRRIRDGQYCMRETKKVSEDDRELSHGQKEAGVSSRTLEDAGKGVTTGAGVKCLQRSHL